MSSKISDYELAKAALATVSGVSLRPAGRRLCGLSHQRVKDLRGAIEDYEAGKIESFPEMQQDTRDKLTEALRRHSSGGTAPAGTGVQPKGAGSRADLTRYVDAIIATDGPPEVRAWQISELLDEIGKRRHRDRWIAWLCDLDCPESQVDHNDITSVAYARHVEGQAVLQYEAHGGSNLLVRESAGAGAGPPSGPTVSGDPVRCSFGHYHDAL